MNNRIKSAIPLFVCAYLFMIWVQPVAGVKSDEIFPFFGWTLFSRTPSWRSEERGVIAHAIDGKAVDGVQYLIPNIDVGRSQKILRRTIHICLNQPPDCDAAVERLLHPVVKEVANSDEVEFSIVFVRTDLHEVRAAIDDLAAGRMSRTDFYSPRGTIGRWHTKRGRIPDAAPLPVGTAMWNAVERHIRQAEPLAQSRFDVFLHDGGLIYFNDACTEEDLATRFFLHVWPKDAADLPSERRRFGFDNHNFNFLDHFFKKPVEGDPSCIAVAPLPDYQISRIQTGQFISGTDRPWDLKFDFPEAAPEVRFGTG